MSQQYPEKIRRGVMYIRESTREQGQGFSPEAQRDGIRSYARKHKIKIIGEYVDFISGTTDERPEFQHMIADAEARKFDTVLVYKTSRFSRDRTHAASYKKLLRGMGIQVISTSENIGADDDSLNASFMEATYEVWDENWSRQIGQWTRAGLSRKKSEGYILGNPPLGYFKEEGNPKDVFVDKKEAALVREIFEMYASGIKSLQDIAVYLNENDHVTKLGNQFTYSTIKCILQNRVYLGVIPIRGTSEEIPGRHKAIINRDLFIKAQRMFGLRNKTKGRPIAQHRFYLLQDLVYCYHCFDKIKGKEDKNPSAKMIPKMFCQTNKSKAGKEYYLYSCKFKRENKTCSQNSVPCQKIDNQVLEFMSGLQMPEDLITEVVERQGLIFDSWQCLRDTKKNAVSRDRLEKQLKKLNHVFLESQTMSFEDYNKRLAKINQQLDSCGNGDNNRGKRPLSKEQQLKATEAFLRNIPILIGKGALPKEELRAWIVMVIKRVWIENGSVVAIEPHDEYKDLFSATKKVFTHSPLIAPGRLTAWTQGCLPPSAEVGTLSYYCEGLRAVRRPLRVVDGQVLVRDNENDICVIFYVFR